MAGRSVDKLKSLDESTWQQVYDDLAPQIFSVVLRRVGGNRHLAEEAHQATWVAASEKIREFDAKRGSLTNWLLGIARNQAAMQLRTRSFSVGNIRRVLQTSR